MSGGAAGAGTFYAQRFLAEVPRVLTLLDRHRLSRTYGCLDRNHWHYRTQDFPSGMYAEYALALAHAHAADLPGSRWRGEPALREWALAACRYAARSAHADGSCDDYYPNERALGATAFAASAVAETMRVLDERPADLVAFARKRATWLLDRHESGTLSNHHALVALAGARAAAVGAGDDLRARALERLAECLSWQHAEGWFPEYEGADPGYQTLTIAFLAALREVLPSPPAALDAALERALAFAAHFLHPDGSYGGEHGSRNTCQVLPSGFERLASRSPTARYLADGWLAGAQAGVVGRPDDDRILCHTLGDLPVAHAARVARGATGPAPWAPSEGVTSFPAARLLVVRRGDLHLVVGTSKGGAFRAFRGGRLLRAESGLVARDRKGRLFGTDRVDPTSEVEVGPTSVTVRGRFQRAKANLPTPGKVLVFRAGTLTLGRVAPDLVRRLLQGALITGKQRVPLAFERTLDWGGPALVVRDRVVAERGAPALVELAGATDATSIYVATSRIWQDAGLQPWADLSAALPTLASTGAATVERSFP
ncbi:MAG: hypothetical protein IT460_17375 [Planctomycetes bacterium]|nr:hypothetical protein [Planctomycetota bacterium]